MVGIPGKSKGCITCRRRKIRCDQQRPDCSRCIKSGRSCEGYATYPTFLNQTINGPQKRHGLEEAKPRQSTSKASQSVALSRTVSPSPSDPQLSRTPSATDIYDVQLIAQFWQSWTPNPNGSRGEWDRSWLQQAISTQNPTEALDLSIKALAFTRLGWLQHDTALATRGNMLYGRALRELQLSLWDERTMWLDETLAAAYALSVYELFETTTSSIKGWNSHLSGLGHLVRLRGPYRHQKSLGRAVLEAYRFSSMIQSIQFRKKSFLLEPEWRERPWEHDVKDNSQRLYDHGFELGALQSQMDDAGLQRGELTPGNFEMFMGCLKKSQSEIDAWYQDYVSVSPSPLYWVSNISYGPILDEQEAGNATLPGPFTFPSLRHATTITSYWALKIAIAGTFRQLLDESARPSSSPSPTPPSRQHHGSTPPQSRPHSQQQPAQTQFTFPEPTTHFGPNPSLPFRNPLASQPVASRSPPTATQNENQPTILAVNIMRTMPFSLADEQGMLGAQQSLFPLRVALFILRLHPGLELQWCRSIYNIMDQRKGLRYATEIAKLDGGHGTRGNERKEGVTPAHSPPPREDDGPYTVAQDRR